jgi:tetratricopeptide (TPR) repeat protein
VNKPPLRETSAVDASSLSHTRLLQDDLLARIEARLAQVPASVELRVELAHLLAELKRPKEAAQIYRQATRSGVPKYDVNTRAYSVLPYRGKTLPITVLLLVPPKWGNAPFRKYLDDQIYLTLQVITDFHDPGLALPPHLLAVNCISDADLCPSSLQAAADLLARSETPVINGPNQVLRTTRESNARRLGSIPGVRTPKIATYPRSFFAAGNVTSLLHERGFTFPLLLRAPGYHTGLHFLRVESPDQLAAAVSALPGDDLCVMEFLDARGPGGDIRKYRVMFIDGKFYPAHAAISKDWKVHFFSAGNAAIPEHPAEDAAFLGDMAGVLGERVMATLDLLKDEMKLDYWGIDFSVSAKGEILLFEANATMNVNPPDENEIGSYRRQPVQRIADAVRAMFYRRAFSSATSPAHTLREFTLRQMEARLQREPDFIELNIDRARLLIEMERLGEAQQIYLEILVKDPAQSIAINNLAALFSLMGHVKEALKLYRGALALSPDNPIARVNLAHHLREAGELEEARLHYEAALQLVPDHVEAHRGLAYVLMYLREDQSAWEHRRAGLPNSSHAQPVAEERDLVPILILVSPCGGNSPITRFLDQKTFRTFHTVPDFYDASMRLPAHRLVLNAIGDADHCGTSLHAAERVLEQTTAPVINLPRRIVPTGRADNARLLAGLEGVVTPRIASFSREVLAGSGGIAALEKEGFTFPLLVRTPGFHEGSHFLRIEKTDALAAAAAALPGRQLMAIQYLDAREPDGKIRKYRVMMVDGKLYPLHKAVSREWMIHYFSAEMADSFAHRAEDAAFLDDMPAVLGPIAVRGLERIRDALGLDYAGADFSLGPDGKVLLFEANATMAVPHPAEGEKWEYRRAPVLRIHAAVRQMILQRAGHAAVDNPPLKN